jgi:protein-disulfide isomerase
MARLLQSWWKEALMQHKLSRRTAPTWTAATAFLLAFVLALPCARSTEATSPTVALDDQFRAGNPKAPVTLVIYACPRSESCAKLLPDLYREVTTGRLKDKATLVYRPFFPPDNPEALECGRGLYAAAYQGKFWPYLIHLCLEREHLSQTTIRDWAGSHGLDRCIFDQTCEQPGTASWLETSRKEGLAKGVNTVPAAFINGRQVKGRIDAQTLVGFAEEEYQKLSAQDHVPGPEPAPAAKPRAKKRP